MIKSLIKKIQDKLFVKKIEEYQVKVGPSEFEKIEKAIKDENALLWAKVEKLEKENQYLKQLLAKLRDEFETTIQQEIDLQEKRIRLAQKRRTYDIFIRTKKPIKVVDVVDEEPFVDEEFNKYPYLRGIRLIDNPNGTIVGLILGKTPRPPLSFKKEPVIVPKLGYLQNLPYLIYKPLQLFEHLKTGQIMVNVDEEFRKLPVNENSEITVLVPHHIDEIFIEEGEDDVGGEHSEGLEQDTEDNSRTDKARTSRPKRHTKTNRKHARKDNSTND